MSRLRARVKRLEHGRRHGALSDDDRAHIAAWHVHTRHKYSGGLPPTEQQAALIAAPGFWTRLQTAWGRPAWARLCVAAIAPRRALEKAVNS